MTDHARQVLLLAIGTYADHRVALAHAVREGDARAVDVATSGLTAAHVAMLRAVDLHAQGESKEGERA